MMRCTVALFALGCAAAVACRSQTPAVITVDHGPNAPNQQTKPYVVLVSLDGFRYDYARRYGATHLQAIAARGATAPDGMLPVYPSLTFPNHYSLATGLYPEHHGIVANTFYDPARKQTYSLGDSMTVTDGTWYSGTPLWVLAEQHGMRSACFFWPGSEAAIQGVRPTYYLKYDRAVPNAARVAQVIAWLRLPAEQRPHFITLYMSDVDQAGHLYGPDGHETEQAVHAVDQAVGTLDSALATLHLTVDLIVVSDHGMAAVKGDWIDLDHDESDIMSHLDKSIGPSLYAKTDSDAAHIAAALTAAHDDKYLVYRRAQVPTALHDDANARSGDPIIVPTGPYLIRANDPPGIPRPHEVGAHGFSPAQVPEMKSSFFAVGPQIRRGATVASFEDVDVYPLVAKILGLEIGPIDGTLTPVQSILVR
jgi:predicted AlkP superfamily pyrophosphatase or phosphodiesterase